MAAPLARRAFLQRAALLPAAATAALGLAGPPAHAASTIRRTGGARIKLSLNAYSFNGPLMDGLAGKPGGLSLLDVLDFCAEHGFDAIDPTGYYFPGYPAVPQAAFLNKFKKRAFELGLDISGTGIRTDFATPDAAKRAADVQLAKAWIEAAARMGAPVIRVFAGAIPKGYEQRWDEAAAWLTDCLRECTEHGRAHGVVVGVQNHGDMLRHADDCLKIIAAVDSEWFGLIVDTGNMQVPDPYADIARVVPHAVNWQVKESPRGPNSPERTDLPRLYRIIRDGGYRGYVPIETLAGANQAYDPRVAVPAFTREVRSAMAAL